MRRKIRGPDCRALAVDVLLLGRLGDLCRKPAHFLVVGRGTVLVGEGGVAGFGEASREPRNASPLDLRRIEGQFEFPELADGEPAALAMELSKLTFAAAWRRGGSRPLGPSPPPQALDAGIDDERRSATPISTLL